MWSIHTNQDQQVSTSDERQPVNKKAKKSDYDENEGSESFSIRSVRSNRKSLAPELLRIGSPRINRENTSRAETVIEDKTACRLKGQDKGRRASIANNHVQDDIAGDSIDIDSLNLGPNPTAQMIARKRKSLATTGFTSSPKSINNVSLSKPKPKQVVNISSQNAKEEGTRKSPGKVNSSKTLTPTKKTSSPAKRLNLSKVEHAEDNVFPLIGYPGTSANEIFIAEGVASQIKYEEIKKQVKSFKGANLIVLHTPTVWGPVDVFNLVMNVRQINRKAAVTTFR